MIQEVVADGQLLIAALIALLAGIISFASPCVLPLVPGYLAYVGGVSGVDAGTRASRRRVVLGVVLFIAGFSAVFVAYYGHSRFLAYCKYFKVLVLFNILFKNSCVS